ncbi:MAG: CRTAC1 family protein [Thermogutta sp.]
MHRRWILTGMILAVSAVVVVGLTLFRRVADKAAAEGTLVFRDVTSQSGIRFVHTDGSSGQRYIVETVSAGLAVFDYDGDGDLDIYFLNGAPLRGTVVEVPPKNALYRNDGNWRFTDVTEQAGVGDTGYGLGVAVGDYNNDGWPDLYVNNDGPNVLYRNNGDGTFTDVTDQAGVSGGKRMGAGAAFLDYDLDGDLDLYVANYVRFSYDQHRVHIVKGYPMYAGPRDYAPEPDVLYRNNGDGTFTDVSLESGIGKLAGSGMGMVCYDYDDDGDTDVFVLNDVSGNFLFRNNGDGTFSEVGLETGFAYNGSGDETGSMGIDCGDYDNDGRLDLFMTCYQGELPVLYHNLGNGSFEDTTVVSGAGSGSFPYVNWGTGWFDFDNDGWRDLFICQGHLQDNIDLYDDTTAYEVRNSVLRNRGDGTFEDISRRCGDGLAPKYSSRGVAFGDLDGDGDMDVVVLNSRNPPTLIRNDQKTGNHWVQLRLRGTTSNRDAVGAKVTLIAGDLRLTEEVLAGRGYQSHWGSRLHFGLGRRQKIDRIEIRWPRRDQGVETWTHLPADRFIMLTEGEPRPMVRNEQF